MILTLLLIAAWLGALALALREHRRALHWKARAEIDHATYNRTTAVSIELGDAVFVWAHHERGLTRKHVNHDCEMWRQGTVQALSRVRGEFLELEITFDDGRVVYARPNAVTYVLSREPEIIAWRKCNPAIPGAPRLGVGDSGRSDLLDPADPDGPAIDVHTHIHLDGREIAQSTARHLQDRAAQE